MATTQNSGKACDGWKWEEARAHFEMVDPAFHAVVSLLPDPLDVEPAGVFESLARAIVGQQLSTKAAATIWSRFLEVHDSPLRPKDVLAASEETHRGAGVSRQKHAYLQDLAFHCSESPVDFEEVEALSDEEIVASWTRVKGLGKWTVQMHLMFQLRRPDVFAPDDLGLRRAMEAHFGMVKDGPRSAYEKRALIWGPFRTAACRFLWNSLAT